MDYFAILAVLAAYTVKGLSGFANTLVFSSIMSFHTANRNITPMDLLVGYPSNLLMALRERRSISWKVCGPLAALVIAGGIPGALLLKTVDAAAIKAVFGAVILLLAVDMLLRERAASCPGDRGRSSRLLLGVIGAVSGVLCGLFGIGAFLAAYMGRITRDSAAFRANLCVVFLLENTFRIALYTAMGILTLPIFRQALTLLPVMLVGLGLGILLSKRVSERLVRVAVILLLAFSGVSLLVGNAAALWR